MFIQIIAYLVLFFGLVSLFRMFLLLIGSDFYTLKKHFESKRRKKLFTPKVSVIIPAFNEEKTILRAITSVHNSSYPRNKFQIIVVDDGSKDKTSQIVKTFIKNNKVKNTILVKQKNSGKAKALNNAIKNYANGELVMCLDADSCVNSETLINVSQYFADRSVSAVSCNVKIIPSKSIFNLIQRFEYLVCYQMKRAHSFYNIEYIVGGVGSTLRKSVIEKVGYYDTDTVTEDIDITMKILRLGNLKHRIVYAFDAITYTESVLDIKSLIRQRFRWKWGRSQTFLKNTVMFFNLNKIYSKGLTWFYLPFAVFSDFAFFLEPLTVFYIFYLIFKLGDTFTILNAFLIVSTFVVMNIIADDTLKLKEKLVLLMGAPFVYFYFYIISFTEYVALIKTLIGLRKLRSSLSEKNKRWIPVERLGRTVSLN